MKKLFYVVGALVTTASVFAAVAILLKKLKISLTIEGLDDEGMCDCGDCEQCGADNDITITIDDDEDADVDEIEVEFTQENQDEIEIDPEIEKEINEAEEQKSTSKAKKSK